MAYDVTGWQYAGTEKSFSISRNFQVERVSLKVNILLFARTDAGGILIIIGSSCFYSPTIHERNEAHVRG
jgi:hypothetical protein